MKKRITRLSIFTVLSCLLVFAGCTGDSDGLTAQDKALNDAFAASKSLPSRPSAPAVPTADMLSAAESNNLFAFDMLGELDNEQENLFFSPFSMTAALSMTYAGAAGNTASQMEDALRFTLTGNDLHEAVGLLDGSLQVDENKQLLTTANSLWGQDGYPFLVDFLTTCKSCYDAPLGELDFMTDAENSRQLINYWVESKTNNRIKDLMPEGSVTTYTRLVLVNCIYFKCAWDEVFDENMTSTKDFHKLGGQTISCDMMHMYSTQNSFDYAETADFQMVEIPYIGEKFSMYVVLPRADDGLSAVKSSLTWAHLEAAMDNMTSTYMLPLEIPKFKVETDYDLMEPLQNLGMVDAFDPIKADFSGIDGGTDLHVTGVYHKAFVEVNEKGTEAAAATGIGVGGTSMPDGEEFIADHPFMYFIVDNATGCILFMGYVVEPST